MKFASDFYSCYSTKTKSLGKFEGRYPSKIKEKYFTLITQISIN